MRPKSLFRSLELTILFVLLLLVGCARSTPSTHRSVADTGQDSKSIEASSPMLSPRLESDNFPWWNRTVFYEVFVRSFADSTTGQRANDGIGDLQGLIERLDYLNDGDANTTEDLGVTGIWLMPVMESPSYHGYDAIDYYAIEQDYGTNEDFKRLIEAAHQRGIRVIVDLMLNHTSREHPWFKKSIRTDSPYRDWYLWAAEKPEYSGPWGQPVWHQLGNQSFYGIFWSGMPDLNYRNPEVTEKMWDVSRFWLEEMGVDGFRLDAVRYLIEDAPTQLADTKETHQWLRQFFKFYKGVKKDALAIGEIWTKTETVTKYVGDQVDIAFQFDMAKGIMKAVKSGSSKPLAEAQSLTWQSFPPSQYAIFLSNHDQKRVMSQLEGDVEKAKLAATILLTSPGVPFIYYGEEISMTGQKPDEKIRTPMQWTPYQYAGFSSKQPWQEINSGYETVNVQAQTADPDSLLTLYRKLVHLRNAHPALQVGDYTQFSDTPEQIYAFLRQAPEETILVLINLNAKPVSEYALTLQASQLKGSIKVIELLQGVQIVSPNLNDEGGFRGYKPVNELAPHTGYVIQLAP